MIYLSTDKAVYPTTVLGSTKLLGERLITNSSKPKKFPIFCSVRLGNVFGSNDSVIPINFNQIQRTNSVTMTNPNMTRFIISQEEAGKIVLHSALLAKDREIFIPKMKSVRIKLLIDALISISLKKMKLKNSKITIDIIGSRINEKIHETLFSEDEFCYILEKEKFFIIKKAF